MSGQEATQVEDEGATGSQTWDGEAAASAGLMHLSSRPPLLLYLIQLWERREFIMMVPLGEMRQRHMNTILGGVWHLLNPLLLAGVYWLIFGVVLQLDRGVDNYPAFLVVGLLTFYFTQKSMTQGARTVVNNVKMLRNLSFPAAVLPISAVVSELLAHLPAIGVMYAFVLITGEPVLWTWVLVPLVVVLQLFMNVGLAFITSRLTVHFRDTEELLPYVVRIWFYFSGVIFSVENLTSGWKREILSANPAYVFVRLTRDLMFEATIDPKFLVLGVAWASALFFAGFIYFYLYESEYANAV